MEDKEGYHEKAKQARRRLEECSQAEWDVVKEGSKVTIYKNTEGKKVPTAWKAIAVLPNSCDAVFSHFFGPTGFLSSLPLNNLPINLSSLTFSSLLSKGRMGSFHYTRMLYACNSRREISSQCTIYRYQSQVILTKGEKPIL